MRRTQTVVFLIFRYILVLFAFALAGPDSQGQITPEPDWFACSIDTECMVERDACGLEEIVNRRFVGNYRVWRAEMQGMMECTEENRGLASGPRKSQRAICSKGRCSIAVTKLAAAKAKPRSRP